MKLFFIILFTSQIIWAKTHPPMSLLIIESQSVKWENGISHSVIIHAPIAEVWKYASDSLNAHDWSVFFDHISPLPGITDGEVGSLRRCFRNANEIGPYWDEVVVSVNPLEERIISTYNFTNFPFNKLAKNRYVYVRQLYEAITPNTTKMTFQTMTRPHASFLDKVLFKFNSKSTSKIFRQNLENIKVIIEGYPRKYPWY